ncbi:MAG: RIP metalloprotease RseP [Chromatiales bacterium]|jgi:regulator of sigma E protease
MNSLIFTILAFIGALAILISIHEFGHFWVARKLGVKVLRFSIGFGKPLWRKTGKVDGTEYVIAAIPLGGYVKMLDEREGPVDEKEAGRAFNRQSLKVRSAIVAAGPIFNFLFAILAYWLVFVGGDTGMRPLVGEVLPDSPASAAGLQINDEIVRVGGRETTTWEAAIYALLASSVDDELIPVEVRDDRGNVTATSLRLSLIDQDQGELDILDEIGVRPLKPILPPIIGEVVSGQPADLAGLQQGDRVLSVAGEAVDDWQGWVELIRASPEKSLPVKIERNGAHLQIEIKPLLVTEASSGEQIGRIGAAALVPDDFLERYQAEVRYGPVESVGLAVGKTWDLSVLTLKVLGKMITGEASVNNLSGPITIAQTAGKSASIGLTYFIKFLAVVSISLGVLNLLPVPVLDGGHLLFFLLEAVKGSPLSEAFIEQGQKIGLILLFCMMGLAFYIDLSRLLS